MTKQLHELIEEARKVEVSDEDLEKQRRSFALGNASMENERVTMETIERALGQLRGEPGAREGPSEPRLGRG